MTLQSAAARAEGGYTAGPIHGPKLDQRSLQNRTRDIRRNQRQRWAPAKRQQMVTRLVRMDVNSPRFAAAISSAPQRVRAEVFVQKAEQASTPATKFTRRLRGMLKVGKRSRVAKPHKKFVEVTPENFELFRKVHGGNTVWFSVNDSPGHLHTLIADQTRGTRFHHDTYGVNRDQATITGNFSQYSMGVQLTDRQMDRFVRYVNAGTAQGSSNKTSVYGFYRNGEVISDGNIKCTNWATTAPIGSLPRWAKTIDRRLAQGATAGTFKNLSEVKKAGGLHAALVKAGTPEARKDLVTRVLANGNLTNWNRSAVKRMARAFTKQLTDFPNRPPDLVLRKSLAQTLGLSRSQDPAKWSYDLMMSKRVPVVAILNGTRDANLASKEFNFEIMGKFDASGRVVPGSYSGNPSNLGVIPAPPQPAQ